MKQIQVKSNHIVSPQTENTISPPIKDSSFSSGLSKYFLYIASTAFIKYFSCVSGKNFPPCK